jgi:hypothetical protein
LQKAPGGFSHLLVAIDKFSKWITDNGTQFTGKKFLDFCEDHHIRVDWAVVAHPMTNG